jgi:hypothetical protein
LSRWNARVRRGARGGHERMFAGRRMVLSRGMADFPRLCGRRSVPLGVAVVPGGVVVFAAQPRESRSPARVSWNRRAAAGHGRPRKCCMLPSGRGSRSTG